MNLKPTFARPRFVVAGLLCAVLASLAIGWAAGTVAASTGLHPGTTPPPASRNASGVDLGAPTTDGLLGVPLNAAGTTGSSGTAASIAYPWPGYGSLGVAPEGTIVAQGTGTASMKADGSDRAAALKKATDAALADAHVAALGAATSMGVGLAGIYSVSITSNESYTYPTPDCVYPPVAPGIGGGGATGSAGTTQAGPAVICVPAVANPTPTSAQLVVTLVVAYKYA